MSAVGAPRIPRPVSGVLLLDFDGTVAVGDDPVRAYARELGRGLPADRREELVDRVDAFLAGADDPELRDAPDGYWAAALLAASLGLPDDARGPAFLATRDGVHSGRHAIRTPPELPGLLDDLRDDIGIALVSNAPHDGLADALALLGILDRFDVVLGDAGKPAGLGAIARSLLDGRPPARLLSIGDIWQNDLEPIAGLGGVTAMVDRWDRGVGHPTWRGRDFGALVPGVREWVRSVRA